MTRDGNPGFRDLTLDEAWKLLRRLFEAEIGCALVFVLPYLLFFSASKTADAIVGDTTASEWMGYVILIVVLLVVVFHINDLFSSLAGLFSNLANVTKAMSPIKRTALGILLVLYFMSAIHFPRIWFFLSVLVLIPAGFTYDEYKRLLKDKLPAQKDM